ncbi:MAG: hypothetical protein V7761_03690 [Amylibacter sp.]
MKVLVLGGYGVFGSRICELLCKDGHSVIIAGRNMHIAHAREKRLVLGHSHAKGIIAQK